MAHLQEMVKTMKGCLNEFRATLQERNHMTDLLCLKHTGTVAEYQRWSSLKAMQPICS